MELTIPQFGMIAPSPALAPFVQTIWWVRAGASPACEVILPNGAIELMINFGPTQRVLGYGAQASNDGFERVWLAGIQDQPLVIASPYGCDHMGVRFRPGGAHAFFDIAMDSTLDRVIELEQLIGNAAIGLRDRLGVLADYTSRAREVESWLLERRRAVHPYYSFVRQALDLARTTGFRTGVADLCGQFGLSNRHLIDQFRRLVGVPPKTLLRIERFHGVIRHAQQHDSVDWARLAHRHGFADQSHLVREFHRFAGATPTHFLRHRTFDGNMELVSN